VCSEVDRSHLLGLAPGANIEVFENGLDLDFFRRRVERSHNQVLLFTGNMSYAPNIDAAETLCREILPRVRQAMPSAVVELAGQSPGPRIHALGHLPGVTVTGFVPDLRDAYERCELALAPVRFGAGTLNKVLEPLAMEVPTVATRVACGGMSATGQASLVLVDEIADFADAVIDLLHDRVHQSELAAAGRKAVEADHDWDSIVARFSAAHLQLAGSTQSAELG
jgi:polysaccharide biosynthesis protein PslH